MAAFRIFPFFLRVVRLLVVAYLVAAVFLWFFQPRMMYFPHHYSVEDQQRAGHSLQEIASQTSQGRQISWYLPSETALPAQIWVFFPGNGSVAFDWLDFLSQYRQADCGYLLIDYPSYGACEGQPSPSSILESTESAWRVLGERLKLTPKETDARCRVLGHSLGAATGLQFAARHPVREMILLAPFTSMVDMGRRRVGWPLAWLCHHRYDNRARLTELATHQPRPRVTIFHGVEDGDIPVTMSRELRDRFAPMVELREIAGAGHTSVVSENHAALARMIRQSGLSGQ